MVNGKAEDAGGLAPAKDDNAAVRHLIRRTLLSLGCVDYISGKESTPWQASENAATATC